MNSHIFFYIITESYNYYGNSVRIELSLVVEVRGKERNILLLKDRAQENRAEEEFFSVWKKERCHVTCRSFPNKASPNR